jgi:M6 family metalloprotease-like protein
MKLRFRLSAILFCLVSCAIGFGVQHRLTAQDRQNAVSYEVSLQGWFGVQWTCSDLNPTKERARLKAVHEQEPTFVLMQENGNAIPLRVPKQWLDTNGGYARLQTRFVQVTGTLTETRLTDGRLQKEIAVSTLRRDPRVAPPSQTPLRQNPTPRPGQIGAQSLISGNKPFLVLLMRFSDIAATPKPKSYYEGLMGSTNPGMRHFFLEQSNGKVDVSGSVVLDWQNLPGTKASYTLPGNDVDFLKVIMDAAAVALASNPNLDFRQFYGINVMVNDRIGDWWGQGTQAVLTLNGMLRTWGASIQTPNHEASLCGHEMGHTFGLDHSSGPYTATYDSRWDNMSIGRSPIDPTYGHVGVNTNAYHKSQLGWITSAQTYLAFPGTSLTFDLERVAQPVSASNYRMAKIFYGGWATKYYTVEFRQKVGYDNSPALPAEGVVLHSVDEQRAGGDRTSQVVDTDSNNDPNDAAAVWTAGEVFNDATNGITVRVNSVGASSANVTITVTGSAPTPRNVTNTQDSGPGSLRNALHFANQVPNTVVNFRIPLSDAGYSGNVWTIRPISSLPDIYQTGTIVEGRVQTVYAGDKNLNGPEMVLDGSNAGSAGVGFTLNGKQLRIGQFVIQNFQSVGIYMDGDCTLSSIQRCFIGLSPTGNTSAPNQWGVVLRSGAKQNLIGQVNAVDGNVISGNTSGGVALYDPGTNDNTVRNNRIGTNAAGTNALPNGFGVMVSDSALRTLIIQNLISGNTNSGVNIHNANSSSVRGNVIGLNAAGNAALPNTWGVYLSGTSTLNTIGGRTAGERNILSGNSGVGVGIVGAPQNVVAGNYIDTNPAGMSAIGNDWGVWVADGAERNTIGSPLTGGGNLISGNRTGGIGISNASRNNVYSNGIGVDATGTGALGNIVAGIWLQSGAQLNRIGSVTIGAGNIIANDSHGIIVMGTTTTGNTIRGNSMYNNVALGIDLLPPDNIGGPTFNDVGDGDSGGNNVQNLPIINSIVNNGTNYTIQGSLFTTPNTSIWIDIYSSPSAHSSGFGEGAKYEGTVVIKTDAAGNATFSVNLALTHGSVTATATSVPTGDTSEFSPAVARP